MKIFWPERHFTVQNIRPHNDTFVFQVEKLLGKRTHNGKVEYLIRWKGCRKEDDSWEPVKNLKGCQPLIKHFNKTRSPSPGRKAKTPKVNFLHVFVILQLCLSVMTYDYMIIENSCCKLYYTSWGLIGGAELKIYNS